jgi:hypothetical protein
MGTGPQGPQGPQGPRGPQGLPNVQDPNTIADTLGSQNAFLNRLATNIANNVDLSTSLSNTILQSPSLISNNLANNSDFVNNVGNYVSQNTSLLAGRVADGIITNPDNISKLTETLATSGTFLSDLSNTLNDFNRPYAQYIQGPTGNISNLRSVIQPISLLCDTSGNCLTPRSALDFYTSNAFPNSLQQPSNVGYLNYTDGNLLLTTKNGTPAFRISADGKPWITGFSGGQLGTYNNNTGEGTVALKWNAQGDLIDINIGDLSQTSGNFKGTFDIKIDMEGNVMGDIIRTTGSLKINGNGYLYDLYATGTINAKNNMTAFNTQGSSFVRVFMHTGAAGSHKGGSGTTDGSTFTIIKNGPYKTTYGGRNAAVLNNFGNPYILGDSNATGNIYMLNNGSNINNFPSAQNWTNTITGNRAELKNNAAIINNTGIIEGINGSLMLIGNAVENGSSRIVSIKDKLKLGTWELSQSADGKLQFTKNGSNKMSFGSDGINVPSNKINDSVLKDNMINGITINNGNLTANSINVKSSVNMSQNISAGNFKGGSLTGRYMYAGTVTANGNNHYFNDIDVDELESSDRIFMDHDWDTNYYNVDIDGDLTVNNSIQVRSGDRIKLNANHVRATGDLFRYGTYTIAQEY